jgi:branched-chain amino acid transport system substrate-binding protein
MKSKKLIYINKKLNGGMKNMRKAILDTISLLLVILLTFTACSSNTATNGTGSGKKLEKGSNSANQEAKANKEPILIGSTMAMTGGAGYLGAGMKKVFDLMIKKKNEEGGINGRQIKIIYYDDENKPDKAVQNMQKLIKKDGAKILIGPSTTTTTAAVHPMINKEDVIAFTATTAYKNNLNSLSNKNYFSTSLDQESMQKLHHEWFKAKGIKKVGFLATTDVSGDNAVKIVEAKFNKQDGIEYFIERMGLEDVDVSTQLTRLISKDIDVLTIIGAGGPPIVALKNALRLGFNKPILFTNIQASKSFAEAIKDIIHAPLYIAGTPPMAYSDIDDNNPIKPVVMEFAKLYKAEYNEEIDHVLGVGYDIIATVIKALEMTKGSDDPAIIKTALETGFKEEKFTTSVVTYTKDDHQGTDLNGAVLLRLDPDLSWKVEWEPKYWEKTP